MADENTPKAAEVPKRLMPSNSTMVGGLGGAGLAPIIIWLVGLAGLEMDAGTAGSFGALIGNILGYFFEGGRK